MKNTKENFDSHNISGKKKKKKKEKEEEENDDRWTINIQVKMTITSDSVNIYVSAGYARKFTHVHILFLMELSHARFLAEAHICRQVTWVRGWKCVHKTDPHAPPPKCSDDGCIYLTKFLTNCFWYTHLNVYTCVCVCVCVCVCMY